MHRKCKLQRVEEAFQEEYSDTISLQENISDRVASTPRHQVGPDLIHGKGTLARAKPNANDFQSLALEPTQNSAEPSPGHS